MENKNTNNIKGIVYVLISAVLFSLAGVLIKEIPWSALSIQGGRGFPALAVVLAYMIKEKHKFVLNKIVIISAVCNFTMSLTFVIATKMTSAANAIVLQFTEPIFVILLMWICFGRKPKKQAVAACIVVFIGILFFFMDKMTTDGMIGNFIAIFSGLTYAVVFLTKTFDDGDFESALVIALILSIIVGAPGYMNETDYTLRTLLFVFIMGACQFGLAFIFLSKGLDSVSPVTASLTSTIEPVLNPVLVAIFCGETIGKMSFLGAFIVLGAATAYNVWDAKQKIEVEENDINNISNNDDEKREDKNMVTMKIDGMMCQHCVAHVKKALEGFEGVKADVDLENKEARIEIEGNATCEQLKNAVEEAGYAVVEIRE